MKSYGLRTGDPLDKRIYEIWRKMHYRCESEKHQSYHRYGGRGIKVCKEWDSLIIFGKWAIESGYAEGLTLDRIDNDKDYSPDNCRWATHREQANNRGVGIAVEVATQVKVVTPSDPLSPKMYTDGMMLKKTFSVRQRKNRWEYRIEVEKVDGKRHQVSKCGFPTKEAAIEAATEFIARNARTIF